MKKGWTGRENNRKKEKCRRNKRGRSRKGEKMLKERY